MDLYGRGYVIEHCISSFYKYTEENAYRVYVTDVLRSLNGNQQLPRYCDIISTKKREEKTAKEVKDQIRGKFR